MYANKYNLRYMKVSQESLGISWRKGDTFEVSVEGFYKDYDKIPLSVVDGIPLACKGNDYGVIGNELLTSTAQGRSYGAEILVKWLIAKKLNLASSFTLAGNLQSPPALERRNESQLYRRCSLYPLR